MQSQRLFFPNYIYYICDLTNLHYLYVAPAQLSNDWYPNTYLKQVCLLNLVIYSTIYCRLTGTSFSRAGRDEDQAQ